MRTAELIDFQTLQEQFGFGERDDRALALLNIGRKEEALRVATNALDSGNPAWGSAGALRVRAQANLALKNYPQALLDSRALLRCNPNDAIAQSIIETIEREKRGTQ